MKPIMGEPLLYYVLNQVRQADEASGIAVLTTLSPLDDVIVDYCKKEKVPFFRGSEEDVLDRYYLAALERRPDAIVRITADCPLVDPEIINQIISLYKLEYPLWDFVSNCIARTYPRGEDVEVISYDLLEKLAREAKSQSDREHVTLLVHRNPELFRIRSVVSAEFLADYRWTVDTGEDFELIKLILEVLDDRDVVHVGDILEVLDAHPDWNKINAHVMQKT